eukprot:CAMPEP_0119034806 /NCGR_PEP_ID=MMETSP1177-20130426/1811_1 /TAXON_ID=2985 /ORGANISM="Ochromonas sp, Strain CCMP1899" /LENGTH=765 /DNA_ID=CAMNT_0006992519 /DNA_START=107 /DNA_END=2404 /DNA_ORIENTATION=-
MIAPRSNREFIESDGTFDEHYHTGRPLGKGSFATVHLAIHKESKKRYAAKIIHRKDMSVNVIRALTSEIEILRTIHHPSIVFVREIFGSTDVLGNDVPTVSIVMELMGGGELFDRIIDKQFYSEREAKIALKEILEAIDYCHSMNIIHRDIKPENLLYTNESEAAKLKVADFGLAVQMTPRVQLTHICGTPTYVAPEVLKRQDQGYGLQADLWSIGVILYILLCGCPPFYDDDNNELFLLIQKAEFDFPAKCWEDVSEDAKDLVTKLLVADPQRRLNAKESLAHPWLSEDSLSNKDPMPLDIAENLRIFNGKRKMKAVRHSIGAINFMRREASAHNLGTGSGKWQIARRGSLNGTLNDGPGCGSTSGSGSDKSDTSKTSGDSNRINKIGHRLMEMGMVDVGGYMQGLQEALVETDSAATSAGPSTVTSPSVSFSNLETDKKSTRKSSTRTKDDDSGREGREGGGGGSEVINSEEEKNTSLNLSATLLQLSEKEFERGVAQRLKENGSRKDRGPDTESTKDREDRAEAKKKRKKERDAASSNLLAQAAAMMTAQSSLRGLHNSGRSKAYEDDEPVDGSRRRDNSMVNTEDRDELWNSGDTNDKGYLDKVVKSPRKRSNTFSFPSTHMHGDDGVIEVEANLNEVEGTPPRTSNRTSHTSSDKSQNSSKRSERIFAGLDSLRAAVSDALSSIVSSSHDRASFSRISRKGTKEERSAKGGSTSTSFSLSKPQRLIDEAYAYFGKDNEEVPSVSLKKPPGLNQTSPISSS